MPISTPELGDGGAHDVHVCARDRVDAEARQAALGMVPRERLLAGRPPFWTGWGVSNRTQVARWVLRTTADDEAMRPAAARP